jgi:TPR repeat protein
MKTIARLSVWLVLLTCSTAQAEIGVAMKAIERGHYATAERALRKAAEKGDLRAQNNLGYLYEHGLGVVQSYPDALNWYSRAAEAGLPEAQHNLATLYHHGRGISRDHDAAYKWFTSAANAGYTEAEYMLGEAYRSGLGVKKDGALALSWYLKAARKAHSAAQLMAASVYLSGEGWRKEPAKALVWAEIARVNGEPQAAALLGKAGKGLGREKTAEAMELAALCIKSDYRECPE